MGDSVVELRKRVKELRGAIVGSVSSAGVEELKKEIAYHESAAKSAERDAKRMEALARAREAKIAKGKAKKSEGAVPIVEKPKKEVKPVAAEKPPSAGRVESAAPKKVAVKKEPKPKKEKVVAVEEVVLSKNIRAKKVKDASDDE